MNNLNIRDILGLFSIIFGFWPLMVLAPLNWRKNSLLGMIYVWGFFAVLRLLFAFYSISPSKLVVEEPINTVLFFLSGGVLISVFLFRKGICKRKKIHIRNERRKELPFRRDIHMENETGVSQPVPLCPKCGKKMVLKTARQGEHAGKTFWGCSSYPKCNGIVRIAE